MQTPLAYESQGPHTGILCVSLKINTVVGGGRDEQLEHRGFGDNEASLCDPVMVGPHHYTCARTHRVPNTEGDPEVRSALRVMTTVPPLEMRMVGACAFWGGGTWAVPSALPRCERDTALEYKV